MGVRQKNESQAAEEAAIWLQRLREDDSAETRARFSDWIKQGAGHLQEFLLAQAVWHELGQLDKSMRDRLWSAADSGSVVDFPGNALADAPSLMSTEALGRRPRRRLFLAAAAVALFVTAGAIYLTAARLGAQVHATELGEQRSVKLNDGSIMHLNTRSRAEVRLTERERIVRLLAGEALFTVAHDTHRPFYVLTDNARIQALGTQFNVYRDSGSQTRVAVVDGVVQVSSVGGTADGMRLQAGDEADVATARIVKTEVPDVERAVAWRARRLTFPGNPASEIAEQFNRYNKIAIRIEGEHLLARRMSGVFDADDPSPFIEYLARDPKVQVLRGEREIIIRPGE